MVWICIRICAACLQGRWSFGCGVRFVLGSFKGCPEGPDSGFRRLHLFMCCRPLPGRASAGRVLLGERLRERLVFFNWAWPERRRSFLEGECIRTAGLSMPFLVRAGRGVGF